jgi:hypothetical protein
LKMKWQLKSCEKKMQEHTDSIKRPWESWALKKEKRYKKRNV